MTTVTLDLPESVYRSAQQIAQATKRPLSDVLQESLTHTLPPLDDLPPDEAFELAKLSALNDAALWQIADASMPEGQQIELRSLLDMQSQGAPMSSVEAARLQTLMDVYGKSLVRKSHAWLLLARRGYKVPTQP